MSLLIFCPCSRVRDSDVCYRRAASQVADHWATYPTVTTVSLQVSRHTATKIPHRLFLFWELRGLSPNFNIHVSVSDLYSPRISLHISSSRIGRPIVEIQYINGSQMHECGNWDWGPDIPSLGIFVSKFRHFVFAVHTTADIFASSWICTCHPIGA